MAFNKDELTPPTWMDSDFLLKVLKHSENDDTIHVNTVVLSEVELYYVMFYFP